MQALNHYYTDAVCTAETIEEMNELLKQLENENTDHPPRKRRLHKRSNRNHNF